MSADKEYVQYRELIVLRHVKPPFGPDDKVSESFKVYTDHDALVEALGKHAAHVAKGPALRAICERLARGDLDGALLGINTAGPFSQLVVERLVWDDGVHAWVPDQRSSDGLLPHHLSDLVRTLVKGTA